MNLKNYYWWFDSIIPSRICDDIVKYGISQNSQLAITGNFQGIEKLSSEQEKDLKKLRDSKVSFLTEPWIFKEIHPFINQANRNAEWNFEWSDSESCQFTKYGLNQHYGWHCDSWAEPYKDPPWRKGLIRKLSAIVALSDSSEYVGGDLEFDLRHQEKPKIVICKELKKKGSIVVFPSFVWHRVKPVTEGTRYSLVAWNLGQPYV
tara:strand:+ start:2988 stop:3602 length:615 start_codon:yes stop_codon:yes gene_type:complete